LFERAIHISGCSNRKRSCSGCRVMECRPVFGKQDEPPAKWMCPIPVCQIAA
jgi:hypothetical protein